MIRGKQYFFFRLDRELNDPCPDYVIAESLDDISLRFGESFVRSFYKITQLSEVTFEHIYAVQQFLLMELSQYGTISH